MGKRLCAFFAPDPVGVGKRFLISGLMLWAGVAFALDEAFLLLPSYDLEYASEQSDKKIQVGDRVRLKLSGARLGAGIRFEPAPENESADDQGWAILEDPSSSDLIVVPLKPGKVALSVLAIKSPGDPATAQNIGRTNPFSFDVVSAIPQDDPKPQEPAELRPPVSLKFPWWLAVGVSLLLILLVTGIVLGLLYWSRKKRPVIAAAVPVQPPKPEDEVALIALIALEKQQLLKNNLYKKYYFGISEILKRYLGDRYGFDAMESTTAEMIAFMEERARTRKQITDSLLDQVESLYCRLDRVKFTDHVPSVEDGTSILEEARNFVTLTRRGGTNAV